MNTNSLTSKDLRESDISFFLASCATVDTTVEKEHHLRFYAIDNILLSCPTYCDPETRRTAFSFDSIRHSTIIVSGVSSFDMGVVKVKVKGLYILKNPEIRCIGPSSGAMLATFIRPIRTTPMYKRASQK